MTGGTDALVSLVQDQVPSWRTGGYWGALHCSIALVSLYTDADHGPDWQSVQHCTLGIPATGVGHTAGLDTVPVDAGQLAGTLGV